MVGWVDGLVKLVCWLDCWWSARKGTEGLLGSEGSRLVGWLVGWVDGLAKSVGWLVGLLVG